MFSDFGQTKTYNKRGVVMIIERSSNWRESFSERFEQDGPWDSWTLYKKSYEIEQMNLIPEFSGLQAPKFLTNIQLLPHQVEAAETVIQKMNGKAILADEVGLGKT